MILSGSAAATAAIVYAGVHFNEHELIYLPFLAWAVAILAGIFWHAYGMYREEYQRRTALEKAKVDEEAKRQIRVRLGQFIDAGNQLSEGLWGWSAGDGSKEKADRWEQEAGDFVEMNFPGFRSLFLSDAGLDVGDPRRGPQYLRLRRGVIRLGELLNKV